MSPPSLEERAIQFGQRLSDMLDAFHHFAADEMRGRRPTFPMERLRAPDAPHDLHVPRERLSARAARVARANERLATRGAARAARRVPAPGHLASRRRFLCAHNKKVTTHTLAKEPHAPSSNSLHLQHRTTFNAHV